MVKLRLPKKVVIIASGVVVLTGASGATAFFIGRDRIMGPSAEELSGVECKDVIRVADMRADRAPWLRKYVKVPPGTDGMTRVKTALRVARKVQETLPAQLIEIAVLDEAGPEKRAFMRGRAVGAEVILVKDPSKVPGISQPITVQYYQGGASGTGMFYGEDATMSSDEAEALLSKMKDLTDCAPPPGKEPMAGEKASSGHEKKAEKKPEKPAKEASGHEAPAKEGGGHEGAKKEAGAKEAKPEMVFPSDVFGKMQKAAFDKAEEAAAAAEEAKHQQEVKEPGMFGKMLGMVGLGGSKEEATGGGHEGASAGSGHEAPAEGAPHGDTAPAEHGATTEGSAHGAPSGEAPAASAHGAADSAAPDANAPDANVHEAAAPAAEASGGLFSKMMNMVGLGKDKPKDVIEHSGGPSIVSGKKAITEGDTPAASAEHAPADGHVAAPAEGHGPAEAPAPAIEGHVPAGADTPAHSGEAAPLVESSLPDASSAEHGASPEAAHDAAAVEAARPAQDAAAQSPEHDATALHAAPSTHQDLKPKGAAEDHGSLAGQGGERAPADVKPATHDAEHH